MQERVDLNLLERSVGRAAPGPRGIRGGGRPPPGTLMPITPMRMLVAAVLTLLAAADAGARHGESPSWFFTVTIPWAQDAQGPAVTVRFYYSTKPLCDLAYGHTRTLAQIRLGSLTEPVSESKAYQTRACLHVHDDPSNTSGHWEE